MTLPVLFKVVAQLELVRPALARHKGGPAAGSTAAATAPAAPAAPRRRLPMAAAASLLTVPSSGILHCCLYRLIDLWGRSSLGGRRLPLGVGRRRGRPPARVAGGGRRLLAVGLGRGGVVAGQRVKPWRGLKASRVLCQRRHLPWDKVLPPAAIPLLWRLVARLVLPLPAAAAAAAAASALPGALLVVTLGQQQQRR